MTPSDASGPRVLVVEDDEQVAGVIAEVLDAQRFSVEVRSTLGQGRAAVKKNLPDLIVLDRQLPDGDGLEFCRELRCGPATRNVPILFLTAKKSAADRVLGLDEGADDYLAKPFDPAELTARVRAILRRTMNVAERPDPVTAGPLRVEPESRRVFLFRDEVLLRPKEYNLLLTFLECRGRVLSRPFLLQRAWGFDKELELSTNVVDVTVGTLRKKLGAYGAAIVSVHSYGFRFDEELLPVPPAPPPSAMIPPPMSPRKPPRSR